RREPSLRIDGISNLRFYFRCGGREMETLRQSCTGRVEASLLFSKRPMENREPLVSGKPLKHFSSLCDPPRCHPDCLRFLQAGGPMQSPAAGPLQAELHRSSGAKKRRHQDDKAEWYTAIPKLI